MTICNQCGHPLSLAWGDTRPTDCGYIDADGPCICPGKHYGSTQRLKPQARLVVHSDTIRKEGLQLQRLANDQTVLVVRQPRRRRGIRGILGRTHVWAVVTER